MPQTVERRVRTALSGLLFLAAVVTIVYQGHKLSITIAERDKEHLRAELIVTSSPYALIMCDAKGRITLSNMAAEQLFGWSRDQLLGADSTLLVPEQYRAAHQDGMQHSLDRIRKAKGNWLLGRERVQLTGLKSDGSLIEIEANIRAIKYEEVVEFIIGMRPVDAPLQNEEFKLQPLRPSQLSFLRKGR